MSHHSIDTHHDRSVAPRILRGVTVLLGLVAAIPSPIGAQAWTSIRAASPGPRAAAIDYSIAANRDDIRAGRHAGQLSRAEAHRLQRENARAFAAAPAGASQGDPADAFAARAAEATHGVIVAARTRDMDRPSH